MTHDNLITDLGDSIREVIDNYIHGNEIPLALVVGLLHCIANEYIQENSMGEFYD